jgi:FkbM family methyltransferase
MQIAILFERLLRLEMGELVPAKTECDGGPSRLRVKQVEDYFFEVVKILNIELFIEIGAMWAEASRKVAKFSDIDCQILAIEANPETFNEANKRFDFRKMGIEYLNYAISNRVGQIEIKVPVKNNQPGPSMSSILDGFGNDLNQRILDVSSLTLDGLLEGSNMEGFNQIALWIDCEGAAYEVLCSAEKTLDRTGCIYVELQDGNIWKNAQSSSVVVAHLLDRGFIPLARDRQHANVWNALFLNQRHYEDLFPRFVKRILASP